jgi:hypothetical protein
VFAGWDLAPANGSSMVVIEQFLLQVQITFLVLGDQSEDDPSDHQHRQAEEAHEKEVQGWAFIESNFEMALNAGARAG